ncbi:hypothetical protein MTR_0568s0010, partial [Medicago truncatula]
LVHFSVIVTTRSSCQDKYKGDSIVQMIFDDSLSINGRTFTFDFVVDVETSQGMKTSLLIVVGIVERIQSQKIFKDL